MTGDARLPDGDGSCAYTAGGCDIGWGLFDRMETDI